VCNQVLTIRTYLIFSDDNHPNLNGLIAVMNYTNIDIKFREESDRIRTNSASHVVVTELHVLLVNMLLTLLGKSLGASEFQIRS
jgi:hypothetical protein